MIQRYIYSTFFQLFLESNFFTSFARKNEVIRDAPIIMQNIPKAISIIVPCYNEKPDVLQQTLGDICSSLAGIPAFSFEVIVVNDGSQKYSYDGISLDFVKFINHKINRGYGASLKTGIKNASFEWIGITDADGTYPNARFHEFIKLAENFDMVVGARPWKQISSIRRLPKMLLTKFSSFLAGYKIVDLNSGMRIFRKEIALKYWKLFPNGFSFTSTITMACITGGYELLYEPIHYAKREGKSHIRPIRDTYRFFTLVARLAIYFNPTRVFMPIAFVLFAAAIARGLRDYHYVHHLGGVSLVLFFMAFQVLFFGLIAEAVSKK